MNRIVNLVLSLLLCGLALPARQQLTNLTTIYIDTQNSAPIANKSDYVPGTVTVVSSDKDECCTEAPMGIRGRGNSTWNMAKKPYRIKFDSKTRFLNLPAKAKSWVLLANYADKTLIRNAIAFEISRFIGMEYTPSVKFVDVVLNGKYLGNYMVTDQTEVAKNRVPVEEQEPTDTELPAISGGYLLEIDGFADSEPVWFQTAQGLKVTIKYPKDDEINQSQRNYIGDFVGELENRMFASGFTDPETGYRSMVDETSLINWYIACELTANSDSFWSTYIYKKRDDAHLYFGPLWDFDIAFNNDNRLGNSTRILMREHAHNPRTWIMQMWKDPWFRTAVNKRWNELLDAGIEKHLLDAVEAYADLIDASQTLNFETWQILPNRVYLENNLFPTYRGGIDDLKDFLATRIAFLTESFADTDPEQWAVEVNPTSTYRIRHSGGAYIAESGNTCKLAAAADASDISFVPSTDTPGYYGIKLPSGRYMGSDNRWDVVNFDDFTDSLALFTVEKTADDGYVHIKNLGKNLYLGTDENQPGKSIYTDKRGDNPKHLWKLFEQKADGIEDVGAPSAKALCLRQGMLVLPEGICMARVYSVAGVEVACGSGAALSVAHLAPGLYIATATDAHGHTYRLKFTKTI